jgi:hypothetical protein
MRFRPETAKPLNELVDVLLRGPHTLSAGERELIATFGDVGKRAIVIVEIQPV